MKRDKLLRINDHLPANLVFTPVDFETDHLDEALTRAGCDAAVPAFFSWLGTTYYLTRDAVRDTIDRIAALAAPETRIALDYQYPRHLVPADGLLFADKLDQFVAKRGEPMLSMFTKLPNQLGWDERTLFASVPYQRDADRRCRRTNNHIAGLRGLPLPSLRMRLDCPACGAYDPRVQHDQLRRIVIFLDIDGVLQPPSKQTRFKHDPEDLRRSLAGRFGDETYLGMDKYDLGAVYYDWHAEIERFVIIDDGFGHEFDELFPEQFVHTGYRLEAHDERRARQIPTGVPAQANRPWPPY